MNPFPLSRIEGQRALEGQQRFGKEKMGFVTSEQATLPHKTSKADY